MIWQILKKDLRRLWLPAALAAALLGALAVLDAWRYDSQSGLAETALNILLPIVWAVLIASAVQLEPLTSDRAFWLTRPYRIPDLVAAKALFAIVAVHVPVLIAHAAILMSHTFSPLEPALLWKQLLLLMAVTLPALALAAVTSTLAGFGCCALAAAAITLLIDAAIVGRRFPWMRLEWVSGAFALTVIAAGAVVVVALQYRRRTRWAARSIGISFAVAAALIYAYLPRDWAGAMQCALEPDLDRSFNVRFQPDASLDLRDFRAPVGRVLIAFPMQVEGFDFDDSMRPESLFVRVTSPGGTVWQTPRGPSLMRPAFLLYDPRRAVVAQTLMTEAALLQAVGSQPVRVEARAVIRRVHQTPARSLAGGFSRTEVPHAGACWAVVQESFDETRLKVACESPGESGPAGRVILAESGTAREWSQMLMDSARAQPVPALSWLSPLWRRQTSFPITEVEPTAPTSRWLVPRNALSRAQIRIQPVVHQGCSNVTYAFDVPDLRKWVVTPKPR